MRELPWSQERLDLWERRTRRLARAGAVLLLLGALLPSPYVDRDGIVQLAWYLPLGQSYRDWSASLSLPWFNVDRGPIALLFLGLGVLAWRWSTTRPLQLRGARLAVPALLLTAFGIMRWTSNSDLRPAPYLPWPWTTTLLPALGLALVRTRGAQRVGRLLCTAVAGLGLAALFFPPAWGFEHVAQLVDMSSDTLGERVAIIEVFVVLGLMGALMGAGLLRRPSRGIRALALGLLVLSVLVDVVRDQQFREQMLWGQGSGRERYEQHPLDIVCAILAHAVRLARSYGHMLVAGVGLYLWIAARRRDEPLRRAPVA